MTECCRLEDCDALDECSNGLSQFLFLYSGRDCRRYLLLELAVSVFVLSPRKGIGRLNRW